MTEAVQPSPTATTVSVQPAGSAVVVLAFSTCTGTGVYFVSVEEARWLRDRLTEFCSGIVIPTNGHREETP